MPRSQSIPRRIDTVDRAIHSEMPPYETDRRKTEVPLTQNDASCWIRQLSLQPHPEGGYYRQTYRSQLQLPKLSLPPEFTGARPASTAIYFLLENGNFSAFHRQRSDELWHFYFGAPLLVHVIEPDGPYSQIRLGCVLDAGETFQAVVKAGCWFASQLAPDKTPHPEAAALGNDLPSAPNQPHSQHPASFALVGCTVAPGFDFEDFELARREDLAARYPQHRDLIARLTRT